MKIFQQICKQLVKNGVKTFVDAAAEATEELMEKYLGGEELSEEEIKAGLRQRVLANEIILVTCGSAFKNKGVQAMLDAVVEYLPAPTDIPAIKGINPDETEGERHASDDEPFSSLALKIATDPFVGNLTFFRVYSGVINSGDTVLNSVRQNVNVLVVSYRCTLTNVKKSKKFVRAISLQQSDLKRCNRGDTLCAIEHQSSLSVWNSQEPVISVAVEPKTKADQEKWVLH